jgi:hypothetical protein
MGRGAGGQKGGRGEPLYLPGQGPTGVLALLGVLHLLKFSLFLC